MSAQVMMTQEQLDAHIKDMEPMQKYVFLTEHMKMDKLAALSVLKAATAKQAGIAVGLYCAVKTDLATNPTRKSWFVATLTNVGMTANVGCSAQRYINSVYKDAVKLKNSGAVQQVVAASPNAPSQQGQPCPA